MATIPFIQCKIFPVEQTADYLEKRFIKHLRLLRSGQVGQPAHEGKLLGVDNHERHETRITHLDRRKVRMRVEKLITCRQEASGMGHLQEDERERLTALAGGVRLATVKTEHQADEIAAALHDEMPWMGPATEQVWRAMRRSVREGPTSF
ncbi:AAA family ATPase, partial [Citreicella sp. C3M06]|nr:AAA family ATPase [Citreicella sp. C3M06]